MTQRDVKKQKKANPASNLGRRKGDPAFKPVLSDLRADVERATLTTDPGVSGANRGYSSMYELARSLTKGKWGNSAT